MLVRRRAVSGRASSATRAAALVLATILAGCGPSRPAPSANPAASPDVEPTTSPAAASAGAIPGRPATAAPEASASPVPLAAAVSLEPIVGGLEAPIGVANAGDGSGRLFILEQRGLVRIVDAAGQLLADPFVDLSDRISAGGERGLLGIAFHPAFADNGRLFVNYTNRSGDTVVAELAASADRGVADPASERQLLFVAQPAPNHNGGALVFGPDGYLYVALGDGGGGGDTFGHGQDPSTLLATILRIDVDEGGPYAIPPDNPFVAGGGAPEVWAYGLRNPWRISFDRATGDLYIADVGQRALEEIDRIAAGAPGGANFGWPIMEGSACFASVSCDPTGLVLPIAEYGHDEGCSVTGGHVYRGTLQPALGGMYIFADYCSGIIFGLEAANPAAGLRRLADTDLRIASFGEDEAGELYLVDHELGGGLYRVVAAP
jgi:glucose/arabinose dehydrogenase